MESLQENPSRNSGNKVLEDALARLKARPPKSPSGSGGGAMADRPPVPRPSSDSTLHRPSSAPSGRSSFDSSCGGDCATCDPSHSQRASLDPGAVVAAAGGCAAGAVAGMPAAQPAAAAASASAEASAAAVSQAPADTQCQLCSSAGDGAAAAGTEPPPVCSWHHAPPSPAVAAGAHHGRPSPFDALRGASSGGADIAAAMPSPFSSSHSLMPPLDSSGHARRSVGKHPANLEHGSTAPPGAVDELAGKLLEAATRAAQASQATGGGASSSSGGRPAAAARFAVPRRSTPAAASPGGGGAPPSPDVLSSQAALLAQQLLLHQQQAGSAAAQLRHSMEQPARPLGRSRTVAAEELLGARGRTGIASAADQLLGTAEQLLGGRDSGAFRRANGPLGGALDPARQPRFSAPTSPPSEEASPFSSVQGVYGCHLLPPADHADAVTPEPSPCLASRSSIDILLDPMLPAAAARGGHRHSLDTLSELLAVSNVPVPASSLPGSVRGSLGSPDGTVTAAQRLRPSAAEPGSAPPTAGGGANARAASRVRHSVDGGGRAQLDTTARTLSMLQGPRSRAGRRDMVDAAASYYGHMLSSGSMHDLANSTVTVVAGVVPSGGAAAPPPRAPPAAASSMVDPGMAGAGGGVAGTWGEGRGAPEEAFLDPDLHDTFGAHPSWGMPARRPCHAHSGSGGSGRGGGLPAAQHPGGAAAAAAAAAAPGSNGWRQPMSVPRRAAAAAAAGATAGAGIGGARAPTPASAAAAGANSAVAAAAAAGRHPTVYPAHAGPLQLDGDLPVEGVARVASPVGTAAMLEPTTVPGQHSVTVHDPQHIVPSLQFLKQRALARQKLERLDSGASSRGGYIAEAKRVLAAAVHTASAQEAAVVESSCSGAIGPLLRYLRDHKHSDAALRSGLHTLSMLVSNSPNRGIIISFHGQAMLCEAMRATQDLEIRESVVQLLWDLEAGHSAECHFEPEDVLTLQSVLEATPNAVIASHILHLMHHCLARPDAPAMSPAQMQLCAQRLVDEIAAHKHHLQDSAQYTLGSLMAVVLGDGRVDGAQRERLVTRLLEELRRTTTPGQCQVVLTVLSCMAGNARLRSAMAHCRARRRLVDFGQRVADPRLRARALSLVKILHKQETLESSGGWYFGSGGSAASDVSASPP